MADTRDAARRVSILMKKPLQALYSKALLFCGWTLCCLVRPGREKNVDVLDRSSLEIPARSLIVAHETVGQADPGTRGEVFR